MLETVTESESRSEPAEADKTRLIDIDGVRFTWPGGQDEVLNIPSLHINKGERVFLQGASGSGKTTLLSILGGVILPLVGKVGVLSTIINELSASQRDSFRADHIGFIFQMFNLIPYLSLVDNVTLPCRFSKVRQGKVLSRGSSLKNEAERLLDHLKLDAKKFKGRSVTELSVGQQQRVAVARALIGSPELIIADEPTSALDADARFAFIDLLFQEVELTGSTLVFVSHDPALKDHFDKSIVLSEINLAHPQQDF